MDRGLPSSVDDYAELLLVNPAHEHLLRLGWRMGILHIAADSHRLASANLRRGIKTVWVADADHCEKQLQDWDWQAQASADPRIGRMWNERRRL